MPSLSTSSRQKTESNRYTRAVHALVKHDEPVSLRSVSAWLLKNEGTGCSLRDAQAAVSAWRESRSRTVATTVRKVNTTLMRALKPLDTDTKQRVIKELSDSEWLRVRR